MRSQQHPSCAPSVSLLLGSVIFLCFSFSRKKSPNRTVQQPGNLMAFPLMPQPIPLSFLNSRVSCILTSVFLAGKEKLSPASQASSVRHFLTSRFSLALLSAS